MTQGVWREDWLINWGSVKRTRKRNSKARDPVFLGGLVISCNKHIVSLHLWLTAGADVSAFHPNPRTRARYASRCTRVYWQAAGEKFAAPDSYTVLGVIACYLIKTSSVYGPSTSYHYSYPHSSREAEMQESVVIFMHRSNLSFSADGRKGARTNLFAGKSGL